MTPAIATLVTGLVIGYLAQRSRMCFVGGIRDYILVRDTALLKGLVAFGVTAAVSFAVARLLTAGFTPSFDLPDTVTIALVIAGGFGVGYVSTLANGCPLRQHVLDAQGVKSSIAYLCGFFAGAVVFHQWVAPVVFRVLP